ncbi:GNS1/SUR4 family protein [Cavenderia fasciculata]|uniref:Elongation of fatty acids protein n=1 Tax=Cavenderia fasciculata TaxID=261658 RepID=F4PRY6_CACFS|nr:GNS1/SUR4 family protein [Cavenderia fasciculata]EGG20584.1 GNS1/SUR4 family protein [Cavenderia fasciculata]|eukprot:XP_004358434.1 GNS1/SUR4 family protein [Cavenderia fasciculata]
MTSIKSYVDSISESIDFYFEKRDQRVMYWPMMERPHEMFYVVFAYYAFVVIGKKVMANQKPFDLKYPLIFHNLILCLISAYITIEAARQAYINDYSLMCNPVDYTERGIGMAKVLWLFYFSKYIELMDTVFMILRKKFDQVSFLHVYHHSSIIMLWFIGINWTAGGDAYLSATMNSLIHTLMYGYYTLAALKIDVWWKRYLTQLQLLQFVINLGSSLYAIYYDCPFPRWMFYAMIIYMMSMLFLFGSFYLHTYIQKGRRGPRPSSKSSSSTTTTKKLQ